MSELKELEDLLIEELKDIYDAEKQLKSAIPILARQASSCNLKVELSVHLEIIRERIQQLKKAEEMLKTSFSGKTCEAMRGLLTEGEQALDEERTNLDIIDALLIGCLRRVMHYQLATYSTAIFIAEELGEDLLVRLLNSIIDEVSFADQALSEILLDEVLPSAAQALSFAEKTEYSDSTLKELCVKNAVLDCGTISGTLIVKREPGKKVSTLVRSLLVAGGLFSALALNGTSVSAEGKPSGGVLQNEERALTYTPDNSGRNIRDRNAYRKTVQDQSNAEGDIEVAARIHWELVSFQKELSVNARNIKVIVESGLVTLRGPVETSEEKSAIEDIALRVAKGYRIINQLEIADS